jgi:hypothetical protein
VNLEEFKKLPLWKSMVANSKAEEAAMVERHVAYILPLMEHYVDTFPTYTLHNKEHIYNVIRLMGQLLGDNINLVSGLEAIVLILSAVYHDFGMVFSEEERKAIPEYRNFREEFLADMHSARVQFEDNNREVSKNLAEWYCRWAHAVRVWPKLDEVEGHCGVLEWNGVPFRLQLGYVCESHNEPAEEIRINDQRFNQEFLGLCDLRFCALLLRLADIMDFDNSRSPQSVYDFLDLGNPKNSAERISKDEWNKHMASRGFQFPDHPNGNSILFVAAPPHPYIEQGIRNFLDLVDLELGAAAKVTRYCADKWQNFPFPERVDRTGIVSNNYLSGKYQFSLSEDKILDLLTGDDLYGNDFVFIRELLQNAIDTVRHRTFIEKIRNPKYAPSPIQVSFFKDSESYHWLRIDDEGMGMNHEIIQSHLLKKGNSYYNSDLFKLEKIKMREAGEDDFVPISRFGIGLLSCFMTCDKIEISTCYQYPGEDQKLQKNRLTIEGRGGFWVIRSEQMHHQADRMPSDHGWEKGYRDLPGTSIACRIKTAREFRGLDMEQKIEQFLLAPEIRVVFQGKSLGGDRNELANTPWCKPSKTSLPIEFVQRCSALINFEVETIEIEVRPIDLSRQSATPNLAGQLVLIIPRIKMNNVNKHFNTGQYFRITHEGNEGKFICQITERNANGQEIKREESHDITNIISSIKFPDKFLERHGEHHKFIWPRVSHNGIIVYDNDQQLQLELNNFDQYNEPFSRHQNFYLSTGLFWFRDTLLPDVTVSRNVIKNITDEIIAHVMYATRELNEYAGSRQYLFAHFPKIERHYRMRFTVETIEKTGLYQMDKPYWDSLPCLQIENKGSSTIDEALKLAKEGPINFRIGYFNNEFFSEFSQYMIEKNFLVTYIPREKDGFYLQAKMPKQEITIDKELKPFQPMTFLDCADLEKVTLKNGSLNKQHPLCKWFISWSAIITRDFFYFGIQLTNELLSEAQAANKVIAVNEILDRLRDLLPEEARPPKNLDISLESFYPVGGHV